LCISTDFWKEFFCSKEAFFRVLPTNMVNNHVSAYQPLNCTSVSIEASGGEKWTSSAALKVSFCLLLVPSFASFSRRMFIYPLPKPSF